MRGKEDAKKITPRSLWEQKNIYWSNHPVETFAKCTLLCASNSWWTEAIFYWFKRTFKCHSIFARDINEDFFFPLDQPLLELMNISKEDPRKNEVLLIYRASELKQTDLERILSYSAYFKWIVFEHSGQQKLAPLRSLVNLILELEVKELSSNILDTVEELSWWMLESPLTKAQIKGLSQNYTGIRELFLELQYYSLTNDDSRFLTVHTNSFFQVKEILKSGAIEFFYSILLKELHSQEPEDLFPLLGYMKSALQQQYERSYSKLKAPRIVSLLKKISELEIYLKQKNKLLMIELMEKEMMYGRS